MEARMRLLRTLVTAAAVAVMAGTTLPGRAEEAPAGAAAPATVYNVELIVFRNNGTQGGAESWGTQGASARNIAGDESPTGTSQVGRFVGVLPSSSYQLTDLENRMRASGAYVPVAHVAWSQTGPHGPARGAA